MNHRFPILCDPAAFAHAGKQLPRIDTTAGLVAFARAIAAHQTGHLGGLMGEHVLDTIADLVRKRVHGSQPQAMLAHLHDELFDKLGFKGDNDDYYSEKNSYLPAVIERRRGSPIAMCMVYAAVGERLGLKVRGIGLPGHFVCSVETDNDVLFVDPFDGGRVLDRDDCISVVRLRIGAEFAWSDDYLKPVTNREWLTRMMQNLLHVFGNQNKYNFVAQMLELEILLWPTKDFLLRDLALVYARLRMPSVAAPLLADYLSKRPDDPQKTGLEELLAVLTS